MQLDYRFRAQFTDSIAIGAVDGGLRIDNYFDGHMTEGTLAGARVRGTRPGRSGLWSARCAANPPGRRRCKREYGAT